MKKILITGSAGFVGQHLIRKIGIDYTIFGVDPKCSEFFTIKDFTDVDCIIHLGAISSVGECESDKDRALYNNHTQVTEWCKAFPKARHIFASSAAAANPVNYYGELKLKTEQWILENIENSIALRFFNVVGNRLDGEPRTDFTSIVIKNMREKKPIVLYGDCIRDYIYIDDIVDNIIYHIDSGMGGSGNIGTGYGYTLTAWVDLIGKVLEKPYTVLREDKREMDLEVSVADNIALVRDPIVGMKMIKRLMGYYV